MKQAVFNKTAFIPVEIDMSVLTVSNVTHGFGARQILDDASFRLLKGEHVGLIGANGEGKSTFLNIITGKIPPDEGKIEWSNQVTVGYLDQHAVLEKGMTIRDVLQRAFDDLFVMEQKINDAYNRMGDVSEDEMNKLLEQVGEWQEILEQRGFYEIDAVIERTAAGLGLMDIGLDRDVTELSGGQRTKVLLTKLLLEKPTILLLDEPTNYLDVEHIQWLQNYLQNYENAFILISHDMEFLNSVVNVIYHIEQAVLTRYTGDYHQFQAAYEVKRHKRLRLMSVNNKRLSVWRTSSNVIKLALQRVAWPILELSAWRKLKFWKNQKSTLNLPLALKKVVRQVVLS